MFAAARLDYLKQGGKIPRSDQCVWWTRQFTG